MSAKPAGQGAPMLGVGIERRRGVLFWLQSGRGEVRYMHAPACGYRDSDLYLNIGLWIWGYRTLRVVLNDESQS